MKPTRTTPPAPPTMKRQKRCLPDAYLDEFGRPRICGLNDSWDKCACTNAPAQKNVQAHSEIVQAHFGIVQAHFVQAHLCRRICPHDRAKCRGGCGVTHPGSPRLCCSDAERMCSAPACLPEAEGSWSTDSERQQ